MKNFFHAKSKGEVLQHLKKYNLKFLIPETIVVNVEDWSKNKKKIYNQVKKKFKKKVALRSSSRSEDLDNTSNAGKYLSFLNVDIKNKKKNFLLYRRNHK